MKKIKKSFYLFMSRISPRYFIIFLFVIILFGGIYYGVYALIDKINSDIIISEQEIISRVKKHLEIPNIDPQSVVRVENANSLKTQNDFFKDTKEGDYIILYENMAIIYDLKKDEVLAFRRSNSGH